MTADKELHFFEMKFEQFTILFSDLELADFVYSNNFSGKVLAFGSESVFLVQTV